MKNGRGRDPTPLGDEKGRLGWAEAQVRIPFLPGQGAGKGALAQYFRRILGKRYACQITQKDLFGMKVPLILGSFGDFTARKLQAPVDARATERDIVLRLGSGAVLRIASCTHLGRRTEGKRRNEAIVGGCGFGTPLDPRQFARPDPLPRSKSEHTVCTGRARRPILRAP